MNMLLRLNAWARQRFRRTRSEAIRADALNTQRELYRTRAFLRRLDAVSRRNASVLAELTDLLKQHDSK